MRVLLSTKEPVGIRERVPPVRDHALLSWDTIELCSTSRCSGFITLAYYAKLFAVQAAENSFSRGNANDSETFLYNED